MTIRNICALNPLLLFTLTLFLLRWILWIIIINCAFILFDIDVIISLRQFVVCFLVTVITVLTETDFDKRIEPRLHFLNLFILFELLVGQHLMKNKLILIHVDFTVLDSNNEAREFFIRWGLWTHFQLTLRNLVSGYHRW